MRLKIKINKTKLFVAVLLLIFLTNQKSSANENEAGASMVTGKPCGKIPVSYNINNTNLTVSKIQKTSTKSGITLYQSRSVATTNVPFATVPITGEPNIKSRCFSGNIGALGLQNIGTFGYETVLKPVESNNFDSGFTIECMVKTEIIGWQVPVGKDGFDGFDAHQQPEQNFAIKFRADAASHHILCHFWDDNTNLINLETSWNYDTGKWYKIAAVCVGGTNALLYIAEEGEYIYDLEDSASMAYNPSAGSFVPIAGGLLDSTKSWSIGRGMFWGIVMDPVQGDVDEVRISDTALLPSEFLGAIPEPGMFLVGIGLIATIMRKG